MMYSPSAHDPMLGKTLCLTRPVQTFIFCVATTASCFFISQSFPFNLANIGTASNVNISMAWRCCKAGVHVVPVVRHSLKVELCSAPISLTLHTGPVNVRFLKHLWETQGETAAVFVGLWLALRSLS